MSKGKLRRSGHIPLNMVGYLFDAKGSFIKNCEIYVTSEDMYHVIMECVRIEV